MQPDLHHATPSAEPYLHRATPSAEPYLHRATPSAEPDLHRATPSAEPYLHCATPSAEPYLHCATQSAELYLHRATPSAEPYLHRATPSAEPYLHRTTPSAEPYLHRATPSAVPYLHCATPSAEPYLHFVDSLEGLRGEKFPPRTVIFHAYCHFEALCDTDYTYSCINCGFYPPVVVMDLHRKGVFKMAVSDLKAPPDDFNGEHDIESFWNSVHLATISRGFFQSDETRRSGTVLNTEFKKVRTCPSSTEAQLSSVTEDHLIDELAKQKVGVVRKLCKACNIDTKGSRLDLITRLKENMKSRQTYDKVFQSIWGASGGWSVILCPHGIVYSIKFNLRAESPRDFADLLLSWKHFPNVCVYDFARGLATHTNLRVPHSLPFQPFEGRLSEPTEENVKAARDGKLLVSLPSLHESVHCGEDNAHPVTGSSEHYVLYDRFHEQNATDPKDILRRIQLVPELKGWLNSQVAEQFFAKMRKSNYFFNNMTPSTHAFLMRSVIHRHNTSTNRALLQRQLNSGCRLELLNTITLSTLGQAVIAEPRSTERIAAQPPTDEAPIQNVGPSHHCGQHCATLTAISNLRPCRTMWAAGGDHPLQEQLVSYVLDEGRPANEILVKDGPTCLTRENLLSLGLNREIDSVVGNACLRLVKEIVELQGKNVFIMDLHIPPTWLPPLSCDPLVSLPSDMPYLRSWWCKVLLENLEIEGHGRRFAHFTEEGKKMGDGSLLPVFRVPRKRRHSTLLPDDILQRILVFVVLEDGCSAILRLALACQTFNKIVSQEHFQQEAHFRWLDNAAVYNAASFTKTVGLATREMDNGECLWGFTPQMTTLATVAGIVFGRWRS
ncbi:unnamed protein product [Leuciscus chuanchicus]